MTVASVALNCCVEWTPSFNFDEVSKSVLEKNLDNRVQELGKAYLIDGALLLEKSEDHLTLAKDCQLQGRIMRIASAWHCLLWIFAACTIKWALEAYLSPVISSLISLSLGVKPLYDRLQSASQWEDKAQRYGALRVPLMVAKMRKEGYEQGLSYTVEKKLGKLYHPKELEHLFKKECLFWQRSFQKAATSEEKSALAGRFFCKSVLISDKSLSLLTKALGIEHPFVRQLKEFQKSIKETLEQINLQILLDQSSFTKGTKQNNPECIHLVHKRIDQAYTGFFDEAFSKLEKLAISLEAD